MADEDLKPEPDAPVKKRRFLRRIFRLPRTPLGIIGLAAATALFAGFIMWFVPYSESAAFCTSCHTMEPQQKAYHAGVHREVACGECHVNPGMVGWVQAKVAGLYELKQLVTNQHTRPLSPIEHAKLPSPSVTCAKCHELKDIDKSGNPTSTILRTVYERDRNSTPQFLALTLRPISRVLAGSLSGNEQIDAYSKGFHWHVADGLEFYSEGLYESIPLVQLKEKDGSVSQWISTREINDSYNIDGDVKRLTAKLDKLQMDCIDCHNRIGHDIEDPDSAVDEAITAGKLTRDLPYIKAFALRLINKKYSTVESAYAAIDAWAVDYAKNQNITGGFKQVELSKATQAIKDIYHEVVSTGMNTNYKAFPNFFGHKNGKGCFRCHDGAHVKVVNGQATAERIPSSCETCHSFPQVSAQGVELSDELPPASHSDRLYVFKHSAGLYSVWSAINTPGFGDCGSCHTAQYCQNCHDQKIDIKHDWDFMSHGTAAKSAKLSTCAKCHQSAYCGGSCHGDDIFAGTHPAGFLNAKS